MDKCDMLAEARERFISKLNSWCSEHKEFDRLSDEVIIRYSHSSQGDIDKPDKEDIPPLRGKEVMMQAVYRGSLGQALTPVPGSFAGTLEDVLKLPLTETFERAILVSTMNAVLRNLGLIENTVHCKDDGPKKCANSIEKWIIEQHSDTVGLVGLQPTLLGGLVQAFGSNRIMASDLTEPGLVYHGVKLIDGMDSSEIFERCPLIIMTGSALVNGTIDGLMENAKRHNSKVVFYGISIAGTAYLMGLNRWCPCSI